MESSRRTALIIGGIILAALVAVGILLWGSFGSSAPDGSKRLQPKVKIKSTDITITSKKHLAKNANYYKAYLYGSDGFSRLLDTKYGRNEVKFTGLAPGETYFIRLAECRNTGGYIKEYKKSAGFIRVVPVALGKDYTSDKTEIANRLKDAAMAHSEEEIVFFFPDEFGDDYDAKKVAFTDGDLFVDDEISGLAYSWIGSASENSYGQPLRVNGVPYRKYAYEFEYMYGETEQKNYIAKVKKIAASLKGSPREKVKQLDTYLRKNCTYDYSLTKFDPYQLLMEGTAVCDGYARAAYLILNLAGVECEYIHGNGFGGVQWESHAWNIVKIGKKWYYCDFTWDGTLDSTKYLLKGTDSDFPDTHIPAKQYRTKKWKAAHPMR